MATVHQLDENWFLLISTILDNHNFFDFYSHHFQYSIYPSSTGKQSTIIHDNCNRYLKKFQNKNRLILSSDLQPWQWSWNSITQILDETKSHSIYWRSTKSSSQFSLGETWEIYTMQTEVDEEDFIHFQFCKKTSRKSVNNNQTTHDS